MQAYGNDYIYINTIAHPVEDPGLLSKKISDRHFGVGSDGLVLICASEICDFRMRIFNPDGTEAEMCGNALRSTAKYVYTYGLTEKKEFTIETLGGIKRLELTVTDKEVTDIRAHIGNPVFEPASIPVLTDGDRFLEQPVQAGDRTFTASSLSWGNPHTVIFVEDVDAVDLETYGPLLEHASCFPRRTNVTFAQVVDPEHIRIRGNIGMRNRMLYGCGDRSAAWQMCVCCGSDAAGRRAESRAARRRFCVHAGSVLYCFPGRIRV